MLQLDTAGTTVQDLIAGAQALNFNAALLATLDESSALAALSRDTPFVAMIDLASLHNLGAIFQWHFVVPVALAGNELIYHDPADGPDRRVRVDDFLVAWATAGYRGVRIWTP